MAFKLGTKVTGASKTKKSIKLKVEPAKGGDAETIECDVVLLSIGRRPFTQGLGLEEAGVKMDDRGFVEVDADFETSVGIFAIGDAIRGPMLARPKRTGSPVRRSWPGNPGMWTSIWCRASSTRPEVATIGKTEEQLKEAGIAYKSGIPLHRERACEVDRYGRSREGAGGRQNRQAKLRAHPGTRRGHHDPRMRHRDGVRRLVRGYRPDLSWPPDAE